MALILTHRKVLDQTDELEELISGCSQNNRGAQARVYHLFYPRMMGFVRRYFPDQMQAEEILNNGFLRAFEKIGTYSFKGSFEGWLRKIMFHAVSDFVATHVKYTNHVILEERDELITKDFASKLYYDDLIKLVNELPNATRVVFNMYAIDGYPHREIAEILGISEGTSKWHLSSGRKILKEKIENLNLHLKK